MAEELEVGNVYRCHSKEEMPPVEALVAAVETYGDLGVEGEAADKVVVHLQLRALMDEQAPLLGHSPFSESALEGCLGNLVRTGQSPEGDFAGGREMWLQEFLKGKAGVFTVNPSDAYWMMLGILDENGALKK